MIKVVAPFAGAWIEIDDVTCRKAGDIVAPFAGAWIEIKEPTLDELLQPSRTLRGCVD